MRTRKILRALQVLAAVHLVAWTAAPLQAQTPPAAPTQESVADFDLPAKPLNPYFLGVNTAFFNRPYDYTNPEVIRLTKDLNLQTIRFPSGSPSNWFNWQTGTFFTDDILLQRGIPAEEVAHNGSTTVSRPMMEKYHPSFKIGDMVNFCTQTGTLPSWVANLYSGTVQEAADWVAFNKKNGYPNNFWELGNEFYLPPYKQIFPTVQAYIKTAQTYTAAMKAADPSAQIAIIGTSDRLKKVNGVEDKGEWMQLSDKAGWNEAIAKESFYDAVIVHDYLVAGDVLIGKSEDEVHRFLMAHNAINMPQFVDYYRKTFNPNVNLWVTEWNLAPFLDRAVQAHPDKFPKDLKLDHYWMGRTIDHALFVADWYLEALRYPENIKITDIHVLASQGFWGLFQLPAPEKDNVGKPFLLNSPYYPVSWIGDALKNSDSYVFGQIEGGPTMKGAMDYEGAEYPGIVAGAFFKDKKITTAPQTVSFKGIGDGPSPNVTVRCLTGLSPLEGWGQDKPVKREDFWRPQINLNTATVPAKEIGLPPASLTYVIFK
jgi:hypothetical protein